MFKKPELPQGHKGISPCLFLKESLLTFHFQISNRFLYMTWCGAHGLSDRTLPPSLDMGSSTPMGTRCESQDVASGPYLFFHKHQPSRPPRLKPRLHSSPGMRRADSHPAVRALEHKPSSSAPQSLTYWSLHFLEISKIEILPWVQSMTCLGLMPLLFHKSTGERWKRGV